MTTLDIILESKRDEVRALRARRTPSSFAGEAGFHRAPLRLGAAIRASLPPAVIAEVKRSSPSAGALAPSIDPATVAAGYRDAGAVAVSVLTDARFFGGSIADLEAVRRSVDLPVLRKDFMVDEIQVHEARAAGADAVLLIAAALDPAHLADLHALASESGLEALVEVHRREELEALLRRGLPGLGLVGINHRDLRDLSIDLGVTRDLVPFVPPGVTVVSESGLRSAADIRGALEAGAHAVLIGEALMRGGDPANTLSAMLDEFRQD